MVLNDDGRVVYQMGGEVKITKKTVSFGNYVYQFNNITGFSDGVIKKRSILCLILSILSVLHGVSLFIFGSMVGGRDFISIGLLIAAVSGVITMVIIARGSKYGLLMTLNSGDRHLFITSDRTKMTDVVNEIYAFMESDKDGVYIVTINDNSINIEGNMTGVAASCSSGSTISSDIK